MGQSFNFEDDQLCESFFIHSTRIPDLMLSIARELIYDRVSGNFPLFCTFKSCIVLKGSSTHNLILVIPNFGVLDSEIEFQVI